MSRGFQRDEVHLDGPMLVNQEVWTLEISVDNGRITGMEIVHPLGSVQHHAYPPTPAHGRVRPPLPLPQHIMQGTTSAILCDQSRHLQTDSNVHDDVGMPHRCHHGSLLYQNHPLLVSPRDANQLVSSIINLQSLFFLPSCGSTYRLDKEDCASTQSHLHCMISLRN